MDSVPNPSDPGAARPIENESRLEALIGSIDEIVFELARDGTFSLLHSFGGGTDGYVPEGGLVMDGHGNLYGTTAFGGTLGYGTIFKISN